MKLLFWSLLVVALVAYVTATEERSTNTEVDAAAVDNQDEVDDVDDSMISDRRRRRRGRRSCRYRRRKYRVGRTINVDNKYPGACYRRKCTRRGVRKLKMRCQGCLYKKKPYRFGQVMFVDDKTPKCYKVECTSRGIKTKTITCKGGSGSSDSTCGKTEGISNEIVGGTQVTSLLTHPWLVRLRTEFPVPNNPFSMYHYRCGGSVISDTWILTAAHCAFDENGVKVASADKVTAFFSDLKSDVQEPKEVERIMAQLILHHGYDHSDTQNVLNDIALYRFNTPVTFSSTLKTVCLPCSFANFNFEGKHLSLAGWGATAYQGSTSNHLMEVTVPFISNAECSETYGPKIKTTSICAGGTNTGKDSCQGDSGGPGVYNGGGVHYVVGVVSYGAGCGTNPGVYTRVSSYIAWIQEKTGKTFCG